MEASHKSTNTWPLRCMALQHGSFAVVALVELLLSYSFSPQTAREVWHAACCRSPIQLASFTGFRRGHQANERAESTVAAGKQQQTLRANLQCTSATGVRQRSAVAAKLRLANDSRGSKGACSMTAPA